MFEPKIETFIRCCTMKNGTKDLEDLLREEININEFGQNGRTPLMETCRHNADPTIVHFLLQNGADAKKRGRGGETALILLGLSQKSSQDIENVLCELLNHGADINESDNEGCTGLYYASLNLSNPEIIDVFLWHGAELYQPNHKGITPAERICLSAKEAKHVENCLNNVKDVQYMFSLFISNGRMSAFSDGWNKESVENCIKIFLQKGLNINYQDNEGMTPLMYFCKNNSKDIPEPAKSCLFKKIMYRPNLDTAAEVIKILIKNGAKTNIKNNQGKTVFDFCNNKKELLAALRYEEK